MQPTIAQALSVVEQLMPGKSLVCVDIRINPDKTPDGQSYPLVPDVEVLCNGEELDLEDTSTFLYFKAIPDSDDLLTTVVYIVGKPEDLIAIEVFVKDIQADPAHDYIVSIESKSLAALAGN